jgi:glycosyltransferase involved in cell wall biosynthesis
MKILYLMDQMYLHGGGERILSQKINHIIDVWDSNFVVYLLTTDQQNKPFVYKLDSRLNHVDLNINYHKNLSYFHPKNIIKTLQHFFALKTKIALIRPDVIVSVSFTPDQYFLPFISKKIPLVKEFHSSGYLSHKKHKGIKKWLFNLFGKYNALVLLNKDEKEFFPFNNLEVIPNFIQDHKDPLVKNKENTILAAGRIAAVKQFDHLIQAWALIALEFPDWQVKIYGDGDDKLMQELIALINDLQLTNIKLMGATTTLEEEMQKASIYAMTSATECFPMVLLEAMDAGMVCVSYNCPTGPGNILQHKLDGILTQPDQIEQFAAALKALIIDDAGRSKLAVAANENCRRFSSIKVISQWNALFTKLHKEKY